MGNVITPDSCCSCLLHLQSKLGATLLNIHLVIPQQSGTAGGSQQPARDCTGLFLESG
jgi:hypothetical protein